MKNKRRCHLSFSSFQIEKIGHRRVNLAGVVSYKKTPADQLKRGIQMGLEHFIGQISNKPVRDLLIQVSDGALIQELF